MQLLIVSFAILAPWAIKTTQYSSENDKTAHSQPLHIAAWNKPQKGSSRKVKTAHKNCIRALVEHASAAEQLDMRNGRGSTPLHIAVASGNMVVVQALLEAGVGTQR